MIGSMITILILVLFFTWISQCHCNTETDPSDGIKIMSLLIVSFGILALITGILV